MVPYLVYNTMQVYATQQCFRQVFQVSVYSNSTATHLRCTEKSTVTTDQHHAPLGHFALFLESNIMPTGFAHMLQTRFFPTPYQVGRVPTTVSPQPDSQSLFLRTSTQRH